MNNIWTITRHTFREALSRKVFITFFLITTFVLMILIGVILSVNLNNVFGSISTKIKVSGDIENRVFSILKLFLISPLYSGGLFLAIFSSSSFIPSMLEKGNIELLLSKPISRSQIILGKYFGVTSMVFINVAYAVIGFYMILGFRFNYWDTSFLITILTITFAFMVLYGLILLIGILTRSSLSAMMLTYLIFYVFSPLLANRQKVFFLIGSKTIKGILNVLYYVFPQTSDIGSITSAIALNKEITTYQPIYVSLVFIFLTVGASIIIFNKKDY